MGPSLNDRRSLTEHLERAWGQALLAVSAVDEEAGRWVDRWAHHAGLGAEDIRSQARDWASRLAAHRRELERFAEEAVKKAVGNLRYPKSEEIQALESRLGRLAQ